MLLILHITLLVLCIIKMNVLEIWSYQSIEYHLLRLWWESFIQPFTFRTCVSKRPSNLHQPKPTPLSMISQASHLHSYLVQEIFDKTRIAGRKRGSWIDEIVSRPHQFHILKPRNFRVLTSIPWCRFFIFHTAPVPLTTCCAGSLSISRRKNSNSLIRR